MPPTKAHLDFESRSSLDLTRTGSWKYHRSPQTVLLCASVAIEKAAPTILTRKDLEAKGNNLLKEILSDKSVLISAHSAHFEYGAVNYNLHERFDYPELWDPKRWSCTLSRAAACGLPLALEKLAKALDLPIQKDMAGRAAMLKLSQPIKGGEWVDPISGETIYSYRESPELYAAMHTYCNLDVEVERLFDERLPELSLEEKKVWDLDLIINRRGIQADTKAAANAAMMANQIVTALNSRLNEITAGKVSAATKVAAIKKWLEEQGYPLESLDKDTVAGILNQKETPLRIREVLNIRRQGGKSSTAKYEALLESADEFDHRIRGTTQYHAAGTGRFGGKNFQVHNLPKWPFPTKLTEAQQIAATDLLLAGDATNFELTYGDKAMDVLSGAVRWMIMAPEGKKLGVADFAQVESRVVLWLSGDTDALDKIRRGEVLYIGMAEEVYKRKGITKEGDPTEYAVGKALILGAGFGMSGLRFYGHCIQYGINITEQEAILAIQIYRRKYYKVVNTWKEMDIAARNAIRSPGSVQRCCGGKVIFGMDKKREFLIMRLPSGRFLRYYKPSLRSVETKWGEREEILYWAQDSMTKQWSQQKTYGACLCENATQAVARDLLVHGLIQAEKAEYNPVMHAHDEIVTEISEEDLKTGKRTLEGLIKLMCENLPPWTAGLPLAAEGFVAKRYRK